MNAKYDGGPAFPGFVRGQTDYGNLCFHQTYGMTLRDYFAATAMEGILCSHNTKSNSTVEEMADAAYQIADAMLEARTK